MAHVKHRKKREDTEVINAINTTPLVDVMLVLLIIFLITVPVVLKTVPLKLPSERNVPARTELKNITVSVDADGKTYWNGATVSGGEALLEKMRSVAKLDPQPEIQVRGDQEATYAPVGRVIFAVQRAGILKVSFITEPPPKQ